MRALIGMASALSVVALTATVAAPVLAAEEPPTIFAIRFNGVEQAYTQYPGADPAALGYPAALADAPATSSTDPEEGRKAMMATVSDWVGKVYDGVLAKITGDRPNVAGPTPIKLAADPRAYQAAGIKADAQLSALGMNSNVGMRLGTEELKQTVRLSRGCEEDWLPNSVSGDVGGGFGALTASVQGSWGSACNSGQTGWRLTAGMTELGIDPSANIGMEYRPVAGSLVANLTGLSAVRAQFAEAGGSFGLEAPVPVVKVSAMRLNADMSWHQDGDTRVMLATKLRF